NTAPTEQKTMTNVQNQPSMVEIKDTPILEYSTELWESNQGKTVSALYFKDATNERCQKMDQMIKDFGQLIPKNALIYNVDYNKESELKQLYAVREPCEWVIIGREGELRDHLDGKDFTIVMGDLGKVLDIYVIPR
ncbi:hypothetical protein IT411_02285, partial [Candidatus Peregrinibacteria bacterium]|nr:hypothetical protein [Candidatus Peregrinibacteria bacterium]